VCLWAYDAAVRVFCRQRFAQIMASIMLFFLIVSSCRTADLAYTKCVCVCVCVRSDAQTPQTVMFDMRKPQRSNNHAVCDGSLNESLTVSSSFIPAELHHGYHFNEVIWFLLATVDHEHLWVDAHTHTHTHTHTHAHKHTNHCRGFVSAYQ